MMVISDVIWQKSSTLWLVARSLGRMRSSSSNFPEARYRSSLGGSGSDGGGGRGQDGGRRARLQRRGVVKGGLLMRSAPAAHSPLHDAAREAQVLREGFLQWQQWGSGGERGGQGAAVQQCSSAAMQRSASRDGPQGAPL